MLARQDDHRLGKHLQADGADQLLLQVLHGVSILNQARLIIHIVLGTDVGTHLAASFTCLALSRPGGLVFVTEHPPGVSLPSSPGAQILPCSEAPLIFIAGPWSHEPKRRPAEHSGAKWLAKLEFPPGLKDQPSQITCKDEPSLFPWDGGRKQEQLVRGQAWGRTGTHSFLQKLVSS